MKKCPSCGTESPGGMKFCGACGGSLAAPAACPSCRAENPPGFKYCGQCGASLAAPQAASPAPRSVRSASRPAVGAAERRQITVMFCDLADSTRLAEKLDPEVYREIVQRYQRTCCEVIEAYAGYVAQYLGDGILVYFGYPQAHEDDARRAVHSGLTICGALTDLNESLDHELGLRLAVRIGIHTGPVVAGVIGAGGRTEQLAVGQTPNIAARLQGLAEPDTVVLSADTCKLVESHFNLRSLGSHTLRGTSTPIEVFQALRELDSYHRFDLSSGAAVVGRERELSLLLDRLEEAKAGHGQVVLLTGEAGIGKSRLVQWFRERSGIPVEASRFCSASPYSQTSALHPLIELLRSLCHLSQDDPPEERLAKLEEFLDAHGVDLEEAVPLVAELLSVPLREPYENLELTPQRKKERTLDLLLTLLFGPPADGPVFVLVEDLHWIDPSSLELLGRLVDQARERRAFILLTFRRNFDPPWPSRKHLTSITLHRLTDQQVELVVASLTGEKPLPPEVLGQVLEKTDGVPLFVEELTKMVLESGMLRDRGDRYEVTAPILELAIPATLQDSLMARLDRLASVKQVAQLGAVLGREFSFEMLSAVSTLDGPALRGELDQLVEAELLFHHKTQVEDTYVFKHALIQDAAYDSLLKSTRAEYHLRIAETLIERFEEVSETRPDLVAHHFSEASRPELAVEHWLRAGQMAVQRCANLEAIEDLHHGLEQLAKLPESPDRHRTELALQSSLAPALVAVHGYSAPEVEKTYRRGVELGQAIGNDDELARILWGLGVFYQGRGDLERALEIARELMGRAEQQPVLMLEARLLLGSTLYFLGRLVEARDCFEEAYAHSLSLRDAAMTGQDTGATALIYTALVNWLLGDAERSLRRCREALAKARELSQPFTLSGVQVFAGFIHQFRGEVDEAESVVREAVDLAVEHGFPIWQAWGAMLLGWVEACQGRAQDGAARIRRGLESYRRTGMWVLQTYFRALLAEACGKLGQTAEGLEIVHEGLEAADASHERFWRPELLRIEGELTLAADPAGNDRAEECFRESLAEARRQRSRSLEQRTARSLARLWRDRGEAQRADDLLAEYEIGKTSLSAG